jgi:hypothetical protein
VTLECRVWIQYVSPSMLTVIGRPAFRDDSTADTKIVVRCVVYRPLR